jgi:DNA polymerase-3 subunit delta'
LSGSEGMDFSLLAGNAALKEQLSAQEKGRGLSHAYLISGPAGSGKRTLARLLAAAMVCTGQGEKPCGGCAACRKVMGGIHPDVIQVGSDGKDITVGQAREARSDAYVRPNEGSRKVYIFHNAQDMNPSAQNALLKLLEEGPAYAAFLLLTENPGGVLTTIRSRCEALALTPVSQAEAEFYLAQRFPSLPREQRHAAARSCGGLLGQAVALLEGGAEDEELWTGAVELLELLCRRDELETAVWCTALEKWDRERLAQTLGRATALLRDALALQRGGQALTQGQAQVRAAEKAAGLEGRELLRLVSLLEKLRKDADFYVSAGILAGALAAGVNGGSL